MDNIAKPKVGPRDFFLWLGAMAALYASAVSILALYFEYIDRLFPDPLVSWVDPYSGAIRFAIATLVVVTPLYIYVTRVLNAEIRSNPEKKELWVRKWLIFITLFVAGVTIAVDLVLLINEFLGGELTTRFLLKSLAVFVVVAGFFWYYLSDLRGKWETRVQMAHALGYGVGAIVLASIIAGFLIIGSPQDQRLYRFDEQKVTDLQSIQWQLVQYWQAKGALPDVIELLNDPLTGFVVPTDPQSGDPYRYERTSDSSFKLCATFNKESLSGQYGTSRPVAEPEFPKGGDSLQGPFSHEAGEACFDRTIDPERYPLFSK